MTDPETLHTAIRDEVGSVLLGNEHIIEGLTMSLLTGGHVLLEGVPGIAKTTAAELFAHASGLEYGRIQMTPDVLPADITGTEVYREATGEFETKKGPIFENVVLADEINRATPKTQSALLEAMAEGRVTIQGETFSLPSPFLLIATQNPIEMEGTFALPEAQRDRFQIKLEMGLPDRDIEYDLLDQFDDDPTLSATSVETVVDPDDLLAARDLVAEVYVAPEIKEYILDIVAATREHQSVDHGASPRASLAFLRIGKAKAAIYGREYVIPDDIKTLSRPILRHRLLLRPDAELGGTDPVDIIDEIVNSIEPPVEVAEEAEDVLSAPSTHHD